MQPKVDVSYFTRINKWDKDKKVDSATLSVADM